MFFISPDLPQPWLMNYRGDGPRDRYLAIVKWASARYAQGGKIVISVGSQPSRYSRIEDMAAARYLGCKRRYA